MRMIRLELFPLEKRDNAVLLMCWFVGLLPLDIITSTSKINVGKIYETQLRTSKMLN